MHSRLALSQVGKYVGLPEGWEPASSGALAEWDAPPHGVSQPDTQ